MHVTIAKIDENLFDGEAVSLSVPATDGIMTVLSDHEPLITTLTTGIAVVQTSHNTEPQEFRIDSGVLEVNAHGATVIL